MGVVRAQGGRECGTWHSRPDPLYLKPLRTPLHPPWPDPDPPPHTPPHTHNLQAAAVLGELAAVDPAEYERQQNASGEKAGVRSVAAFVKEMASCLPRCAAMRCREGWVGGRRGAR